MQGLLFCNWIILKRPRGALFSTVQTFKCGPPNAYFTCIDFQRLCKEINWDNQYFSFKSVRIKCLNILMHIAPLRKNDVHTSRDEKFN